MSGTERRPANGSGAAVRARSLQGRLLAVLLALVAVVWAGVIAATWFDARHEIDELLDGHLAQAAALLVAQQARGIEAAAPEPEADRPLDAPTLHRYAPKVAFQVWHEGTLVLRSSNAPLRPMSTATQGLQTLDIDGQRWRVFAARGAEADIQVFVGERQQSRSDILVAVFRSMLIPMALALPLLALGGWWAVSRGLAPLRQLGELLAGRSPQALQPLSLDDAPAELLAPLAALNGLFERIAALMASERRFTADAAHELRTPIAAIRTQAQVAMGAEDDAATRRHALAATLEGCDRATRLVEQLLLLSRLEAATQAHAAPVDLCALAQRVIAELAAGGLDKGQEIELVAPAGCQVSGDETLLGALLRNLVDNAIRYSPPGARVEVRIERRGPSVVLQVQDSGAGLGPADIARLGDRFFRVPGSGQSGSGLGWSIVRRIARAQRAVVEVGRSATLGGLRVELRWPDAQGGAAAASTAR